MTPAALPLGVFDSGLGGLTVVHALQDLLPRESLVYFGDTARVPYGNKSSRTVIRLSLEAMHFLSRVGMKTMVVACNTASALAMETLTQEAPVPVVGVVEAGAEAAVRATRSGSIGVIGTRATVHSACYPREITARLSGARVTAAACPLLVPLVEEGWLNSSVTREVAASYLAPVQAAGIDTLILGCTHYPLLKPVIQEIVGPGVALIDSAEAVARKVAALLEEHGLEAAGKAPRSRFFVSDQVEKFAEQAATFLGRPVQAAWVDQTDMPWYDRDVSSREDV